MNFKILGAVYFGIGLGLMITSFLVAQDTFNSKYKAFIVLSGSMEPALPAGSVAFTRSEPSYKVGQIITFTSKNTNITHRIVSIEKDAGGTSNIYQTKGDANEEPDSNKITSSHIIGKQFFMLPYLGYLASFAKTPKGFIALVIIPASIIIYEELKKLTSYLPTLPSPKLANFSLIVFTIPIAVGALLLLAATNSLLFDNEESPSNTIGVTTESPFPTPTPDP